MASSQPFGRYYKLTLGSNEYETKKDMYALDIKFDTKRARGQQCARGTLSVLGLSREHMQPFIDVIHVPEAQVRAAKLTIKLEAGYFDAPWARVTVFDGFVTHAEVTKPPEMWLNLKVSEIPVDTYQIRDVSLGFDAKGYKIGEIASLVLGKFGYEFTDRTKSQVGKKVLAHQFPSKKLNLSDAISACEKMSEKWYLICRNNTIEAYDTNLLEKPEGTIKLDKTNGLLGVTGMNGVNCEVTSFLKDDDPRMCTLDFKSELVPPASGKYMIIEKRFHGHFRGPEWYTTFYCAGFKQDE